MLTLGQPDLLIAEKVNHKIHRTLYAYIKRKNYGLQNIGYGFETFIKRFAAKDLYSIYSKYDGNISHDSWTHDRYGHELVNIINNKIKLQKYFVLGERDYELKTGKILFHHSEIAQKFRNTSYLFSFLRARKIYKDHNFRFYHSKLLFNKLISIATFLNFPNIEKTHKISSTSLVALRFLKTLDIKTAQNPFIKDVYANANPNLNIKKLQRNALLNPIIKHSEFLIAFNKLDWINHNFEIATIYWKPNHKTDVFNSDFELQKDSHIKVNGKKYPIAFKKDDQLEKKQQTMNSNAILQVGKLFVPNFTSYDFAKQKITSSVDEFSERGFLIPYHFKGRFFYEMNIGINEVFKNMKFLVAQDVDQQALDPYAGKITLKITSSDLLEDANGANIVTIKSNFFKYIIELGEMANPLAVARFAQTRNEEETL